MSGSPAPPITGLRSRYERARALDQTGQVRDCIDYLQNPEVLAAELVDAYLAIELAYTPLQRPEQPTLPASQDAGRLIAANVIEVIDPLLETELQSVTCLARDFVPLLPAPAAEDCHGGLDFLGMARGDPPGPVLGAAASELEPTSYVLLLRLLCCLSEIAPPAQLAHVDEFVFKGALGSEPLFDLHIVLPDRPPQQGEQTLVQLTHDLADVLQSELATESSFPAVLRGVACLHMSQAGSERALFDWRA